MRSVLFEDHNSWFVLKQAADQVLGHVPSFGNLLNGIMSFVNWLVIPQMEVLQRILASYGCPPAKGQMARLIPLNRLSYILSAVLLFRRSTAHKSEIVCRNA